MSTAATIESPAGSVPVTVIIKALNEERHIEAAVRSALQAVERTGGEVILADSGSSDATVQIASRFPITIVQLRHREERRCGVGPQLGYQRARGEYVYILDGDMELDGQFLAAGIAAMQADPRLGGVGGLVEEESDASYQFRGRKRRGTESIAGSCEWLDMGGLYRTAALRSVGFFSNRNLHAFEEMDLGLRLGAAGWSLRRLEARNVLHHGRTEGNWGLLKRRWKSRYLDGTGELLRAASGKRYFLKAARTQRHLFVALLLWITLLVGLAILPVNPWLFGSSIAAFLVLILLRMRRAGNFSDACFGQIVWQVTALAMLRGYFAPRRDPLAPIEYLVLHSSEARLSHADQHYVK
ncbi:MAG: glycosyltransferase [Steroidobacteraceae bacterium]